MDRNVITSRYKTHHLTITEKVVHLYIEDKNLDTSDEELGKSGEVKPPLSSTDIMLFSSQATNQISPVTTNTIYTEEVNIYLKI